MYEVIGHEKLRDHLKGVEPSFAVIGPPGVGKRGIIHEWRGDKAIEAPEVITTAQAKLLAEEAYSTGMTVILNGDAMLDWDPLLKPIEDGHLRAAVHATKIPPTVGSRMGTVFRVGYLSEPQVLQILAKSFPTYGPRPWLAKALAGHFGSFNYAVAAIQVFEELNSCLASRSFPYVLKEQAVAVYSALRLACAAKVGVENLPWSKTALSAFPETVAWDLLKGPVRVDKHEARNVVNLFFAGVTGGRLG